MTLVFSYNLSTLFRETPLLDRFARAAQCGATAVELQTFEGETPGDLTAAAKAAGVKVVLINVSMEDVMSGGPGLPGVPGREGDFVEALHAAVAAARLLGAPFINIGLSRIPAGIDRALCVETFRGNMDLACRLSAPAGITPLIEPMNRKEFPDALWQSTTSVAGFLSAYFRERAGLQFDIYHNVMNGEDVMAEFMRHHVLIRHVQISDVPGRGEPGSGKVNFARIFKCISDSGYTGHVGAEYRPTRQTEETLGWLGNINLD